jgi:pyruvyltransferase
LYKTERELSYYRHKPSPGAASLLNTYRQEIQQELQRYRPQPCYLNRPWFHISLKGAAWKGGRNFGDDLNLDLAASVLGIERSEVYFTTNRTFSGKIVAIGSVLTQAMSNDIVLGTGLSFASKDALPESPLWSKELPNVTIISVRGPDTRSKVLERAYTDCPEAYGDLGVTASLLIWPQLKPSEKPSKAVCIVPHATDATLKKEAAATSYHVLSISPSTPLILVKQLMECEIVISSSLHALMIADAFGIAVRWYNGPDSNAPEKYMDYFRGIGALDVSHASTLQQAVDMGPMTPSLTLNVMKSVTLQLIRTFPFDQVCKK